MKYRVDFDKVIDVIEKNKPKEIVDTETMYCYNVSNDIIRKLYEHLIETGDYEAIYSK